MNRLSIIILALLLCIAGLSWYGSRSGSGISFGTAQHTLSQTLSESNRAEPAANEKAACETVTILVGSARYEPCVEENPTVLSAMQTAAEDEGLAFIGKEYPSLGLFIESINGKKAESGYYWFLYINGVSSTQGVSSARISPGDVIEWRYKQSY